MKLGDTVTVASWEGLRIAHVTEVCANGIINISTTVYVKLRKQARWVAGLEPETEGVRWIHGSHASKGKPTTAAGRALATAYSLSTLRTA